MQAVGGNPADAADDRGLNVSSATAVNALFTSIPDMKPSHKKGGSIKNVLTSKNPLGRISLSGRVSEGWAFVQTHPHAFRYSMLLFHLFITKHLS